MSLAEPNEVQASPGPRCAAGGLGTFLLPEEFAAFTGRVESVEPHDSRESPEALHSLLAAGKAVLLTGTYRHADGVFRYCQRFERRLVSPREVAHVTDRSLRGAAFAEIRRRKLHRLLLAARGDSLLHVDDPPATAGLQDWLARPTGEEAFLVPLRRLQRILTDMRRAAEGLRFEGLAAPITILPHVYVPADTSVPAMFREYADLIAGRRVLDMGTGTGVLALLAAAMGAAAVVATDSSPRAVANARANAERLDAAVDVRGPADLFDAVRGETFDTILFNAPWVQGQPRTSYDAAAYDPGYRVLDGFLRAAPAHLADGGAILLQYSDVSTRRGDDSMAHLRSAIAGAGLRVAGSRSIGRTSRLVAGRETVYIFELRTA